MKLKLKAEHSKITSLNLDNKTGPATRKIMYLSIQTNKLPLENNTLFKFDTTGTVHVCIDQLKPIKIELIQLCKDFYNSEVYDIDWEVHIIPLLRQNKIINLLSQ
jgi:hypothetical protein